MMLGMKRLTSISAAILGAVLGFTLGVFLAAYFGYHERLHVFAPAVVLGILFAALSIVVSNKLFARTSTQAHALLASLLILCSGAAVTGFFQMVL